MLKLASSILECDARFRDLVAVDAGGTRPMAIADLHAMIEPIQLSDAVPEEIRREFDTARNAFVYSWFVFEFTTLAELGGYARWRRRRHSYEQILRNRARTNAPAEFR